MTHIIRVPINFWLRSVNKVSCRLFTVPAPPEPTAAASSSAEGDFAEELPAPSAVPGPSEGIIADITPFPFAIKASRTRRPTTKVSPINARPMNNVNNKFLLYGKAEFGNIPNLLRSSEAMERYGVEAVVIPAERLGIDLLDSTMFPYAIEQSLVREWLQMASVALTVGTERFDLTHGSKDWDKKVMSSLLSPCLLLSYSQAHGEVILEKIARGLANSLQADFISIDARDFASIGQFLMRHSKRKSSKCTTEFETEDAKNLSQFFGRSVRSRETEDYPSLAFALKERPRSTVLEYIEYCLMTLEDESVADASEKRVIFLNTGRGGDSISFSDVEFRNELMRLMTARETFAPKTLFIISDGCNMDPTSGRFEDDFDGPGEVIPDSFMEQEHRISERALSLLRSQAEQGKSPFKKTQLALTLFDGNPYQTSSKGLPPASLYSMIIDPQLRAFRLFVAPPHDKISAANHQKAIEKDIMYNNYMENTANLHSIFCRLSEKCGDYVSFMTGLNLPVYFFEDASSFKHLKPMTPGTLKQHVWERPLLPAFEGRIWSTTELVALCMSIPREELLTNDALSLLLAKIEEFQANRQIQWGRPSPAIDETEADTSRRLPIDEESLNKHEKRFLSSIVTPDMVGTKYGDIGSLDKVKETLYELISLRIERPELFEKGILKESISGILLFGPPGTGKTMLAKAVAAQSGANFISVNSSSIFDMYVGEGEKNVKGLFTLARKLAPCVVFVDEVDALLETRSNPTTRASRLEIINEFMSEWDGVLSKNHGVTIMAATNRPFALDDAVLRRLPRRILVDLPDASGRMNILELLLRDDSICKKVDFEWLSHRTELYSGSDLKNLCMAAAFRALRRVRNCEENTTLIRNEDFIAALTDVPASLSDRMNTVVELREWDRVYGEGAVRSHSKPSLGFQSSHPK